MAGTYEDDFFSDSILQFLREPSESELEELMEGAEAFTPEIENEAQHRRKPGPIFEAATPGELEQKYDEVYKYMGESFRSVKEMATATPQTGGDSQARPERYSRTILRGGTQIRRQRVRTIQC